MRNKGFTLIELLVVIAIIALLMAIIIPSLKAAKELASAAVCVSNERQLLLAWTSYAEDYDSLLVGGSNYGSPPHRPDHPTQYRWVEYPMNTNGSWAADPGEYSLDTRKNGIRAGTLFPYTQDEDLYHCPGDKQFVKEPEPYATFRSYAITGLMNGEDFSSKKADGSFNYRTAVTSPSGASKVLKVVTKTTEIAAPGNKLVFVEEYAKRWNQKVNDGSFVLLEGGVYNWWDCPSDYHNGSSTFAFADGHAERRRWQDKDTIEYIYGGTDDTPNENEDLHWFVQGYITKP